MIPVFQGSGLAQSQAMTGFAAAILSILVLATFALVAGAVYLLVKREERKQGVLMLIAAAVLFVNVLIWTV
jgi:asparagine N-glycosylation enzyme membrane subunit Stt3